MARRGLTTLIAAMLFASPVAPALAQGGDSGGGGSGGGGGGNGLQSLKDVAIPARPGIEKYVVNPLAAVALGKALFWDSQAGSDGQACASCHFHGGADNRRKNNLNPEGRQVNGGDNNFDPTATSALGPNYTMTPGDYPFHQLADPTNRNSKVIFDTNDVTSSEGTFGGDFNKVVAGVGDDCTPRLPDNFSVGGKLVRRVPPRNTPSAINAVFNYRNFWDGRANNIFNGVDPFGPRDSGATVLQVQADGSTQPVKMALANSALASQAVGPALSDFEMSCSNKTFKDLGRKLLSMKPLGKQRVHASDSVLASYRDPSSIGLKTGYADMIKAAFDPSWWKSTDSFGGYSQMEQNFSLFWGLAIQAYESTLVSDQTPLDKYLGSHTTPADKTALTPSQVTGLGIFLSGKGNCSSCHAGAELTNAATRLQSDALKGSLVSLMTAASGGAALYDKGFYNIGVRPTTNDVGVGGTDAFGNPLSFAREYIQQLSGAAVFDPLKVNPCSFDVLTNATNCSAPPPVTQRVVVDGAFKVPSLRNVSLTQPYFHNGGQFTLEQVVAFYSRGGDLQKAPGGDTSGFVDPSALNGSGSNLSGNLKVPGFSAADQIALVDFLRHGLTDRRVACEQAPFDHPSLRLPNGHVGDHLHVVDINPVDGRADEEFLDLPAVGAAGGLCMTNDDGSPVTQ